MLEKVMT